MREKSKGSILIVDNNTEVLNNLSSSLKNEGYGIYMAGNSSAALKIIKSENVDVTLLDYRIGKEDGIALAGKLRELDGYLKIIILTDSPSYESAVLAMKSGVFDYLAKNSSNTEILKSIKGAVKERAADRLAGAKGILEKDIIKFILFCDHSLIKERLENFSKNVPGFKLVKSFPDINHMKAQSISREIDIALLCAGCYMNSFKDAYGIFPELYREFPGIKPVIINENFSDKEKVELLKLGVRGFSPRDFSSELLEKALKRVKKGEVWVSRRVTDLSLKEIMDYNSIYQPKRETTGLTCREVEILKTMASGLKNREIADRLFISEKTVKTHINRIFKKLGVNTRTKAILAALEQKIFSAIETEQPDKT
jgi:DNA-binding NarL/FixJ family response regulator